jgi:TIR domain
MLGRIGGRHRGPQHVGLAKPVTYYLNVTPRPFISYATEDRETALRLRRDLITLGAVPWIDVTDLVPGQDWQSAISRALRQSSHFLALLSHHSVSKRGYVQKEVREALDLLDQFPPNAIFLIPVRLDGSEPAHQRLRELHWVDLFAGYDAGLQKIAQSLNLGKSQLPAAVRPTAKVDHLAVPTVVMQVIGKHAERSFEQNLYARHHQIAREIEAWRALQVFEAPDVPDRVVATILSRVTASFPDNFRMQFFIANREVESWRQLQSLSAVGDRDAEVRGIIRDAEERFPDDFSRRLYEIKGRIDPARG